MSRVRAWLRAAEGRLADAGVESARLEAQLLAAHALGVDRTWILAHAEESFDAAVADGLLARRVAREPLAYILGYREFFGRRFRVTPDVLIPRQDTEILVETVLKLPLSAAARVLDIGAGSGAIAVTLKLERPGWEITAVDVSASALAVARENARGLEADVKFVDSDLFAAIPDEGFDLIVTNPPYIAAGEPLMPEVARHEPAVALYAGETGLEFYRRLAEEAPAYLSAHGYFATEVGYLQSEPVASLFTAAGWAHQATVHDLANIDRVLLFQRPVLP